MNIYDIPNSFNTNIWKAIGVILGITREITEIEAQTMLQFTFEEFPDYSLTQVKDAFQKYSAKKLSFTDSAYGVLSTSLIGNVLKSYRSYRNKALFEYEKYLQSQEKPKEPTMEELKRIENEFLENCLLKPYEKALQTESEINIDKVNAKLIFKKLRENLNLKPTPEEIEESRIEARKIYAIQEAEKKLKNPNTRKLIDRFELLHGQNEDVTIQSLATMVYLNSYLNNLLKKQVDLRKLLN